jgi:hypothetical protein
MLEKRGKGHTNNWRGCVSFESNALVAPHRKGSCVYCMLKTVSKRVLPSLCHGRVRCPNDKREGRQPFIGAKAPRVTKALHLDHNRGLGPLRRPHAGILERFFEHRFHGQIVAKAVIRSECVGSRSNLSPMKSIAPTHLLSVIFVIFTRMRRNKFAALAMMASG